MICGLSKSSPISFMSQSLGCVGVKAVDAVGRAYLLMIISTIRAMGRALKLQGAEMHAHMYTIYQP